MNDIDRHGIGKEVELKKPPEEWFVVVTEKKEDVNTTNKRK